MPVIGFPHRPPAIGGPGSFQERLQKELIARGWDVVFPDSSCRPDVIMVIGGTRRLWWLWQAKARGTPVLHRLDGINWQHRVRWPGLRNFIRAEIANLLMAVTRRFFADFVVYQSRFVVDWWNAAYGELHNTPQAVIYNGVSLDEFQPTGKESGQERIVCVEGRVDDSHPIESLVSIKSRRVAIYGVVNKDVSYRLMSECPTISVMGSILRENIPQAFEGRSVLFSLDINPACPNSVIEALASGVPVVAAKSGSMPEIVTPEVGILLEIENPFGRPPHQLSGLHLALEAIFSDYNRYSKAARERALKMYSLSDVVDQYLRVIENLMPDISR